MTRRWACLALVAWAAWGSSATVGDVVHLVSKSNYIDLMDTQLFTHNGHDRRAGTGANHGQARDNIRSYLAGLSGVTASIVPWTYGSVSGENVVGELRGVTNPEKVLIIGSHYDSVGNPGADDNASGTAAVLEAARVLSHFRFDWTIRFIAFDCEELGLYGSRAYALNARNLGEDIVGMVSLDMVAYNGKGANQAFLYGRDASAPLKNAIKASIEQYGNGIVATIKGSLDASDHAPFEWQGYQACLLIEDYRNNPFYHTQQDSFDSPGYLDFDYATNLTRATVGWAASQAGLRAVPEPLSLAGLGLGLAVLARRRRH